MNPIKYSLETEHEVLESIMHFSNHMNISVQKAMLNLTVDCFYNQNNREIYRMICDCFKKQVPFHFVDILSLIPKGNDELFDSMQWLMDNYRSCHAGEANFEGYVNRLIVLAKLRKQLQLAKQMIKDVEECPSPEASAEILSCSLTSIAELNYQESKHGISNIEIAEAFYDGKITQSKKIPTTCEQLNEALAGGIMPKSLIIIAGGASGGKTGFSIYLMDCIARAQPRTQSLFFSIEMEYDQIWMRHVGICAGKQFEKLDADEQLKAIGKTLEVPMQIYDTALCRSTADIDCILTTSRLRAMEKPISVIVVDYLGLVQNKGSFERNDLKQSDITGKLAQLAIELNCTVIALSQINRGAANRGVEDRCPWPQDAADSSGGHRSSSLWLGIDRPELYQDDPCYRNQFVVKCRKNRFGNTFDLIFAFNEGTFAEVQPGYFRQPMKPTKNIEKALFSATGKDFYPD